MARKDQGYSFSAILSSLRSRVSGEVERGMERGSFSPSVCCPCWLDTVGAFILYHSQTGAFPSSEFTYKRVL